MTTWEIVRHRVAIAGRLSDLETGKPIRRGRVEITEAPAEFASGLDLKARQAGERWLVLGERPDRKATAADGHFHFLDLPAGDYTLTASLPGAGSRYGTATAAATVALDAEDRFVLATADMDLPPTTVKGQLRGPPGGNPHNPTPGEPVVMAEVRIRGSGERAFSDSEGNYRLSGLEKGQRTVLFTARGYQDPPPQTVDLAVPGAVLTLDLTLEPLQP
jgi:hypothetical protein